MGSGPTRGLAQPAAAGGTTAAGRGPWSARRARPRPPGPPRHLPLPARAGGGRGPPQRAWRPRSPSGEGEGAPPGPSGSGGPPPCLGFPPSPSLDHTAALPSTSAWAEGSVGVWSLEASEPAGRAGARERRRSRGEGRRPGQPRGLPGSSCCGEPIGPTGGTGSRWRNPSSAPFPGPRKPGLLLTRLPRARPAPPPPPWAARSRPA